MKLITKYSETKGTLSKRYCFNEIFGFYFVFFLIQLSSWCWDYSSTLPEVPLRKKGINDNVKMQILLEKFNFFQFYYTRIRIRKQRDFEQEKLIRSSLRFLVCYFRIIWIDSWITKHVLILVQHDTHRWVHVYIRCIFGLYCLYWNTVVYRYLWDFFVCISNHRGRTERVWLEEKIRRVYRKLT